MKPRILIIEDEDAILKGLCDVFVFNGYEVDTATNGKDGLHKSLTGNHHLIILDVMLPEMNGLKVCNEIRKKDRSQPIIMLTAKGDEEDIINGLKLGADDYVTKPFSVRELLARVEAVLRRSPKVVQDSAIIRWGNFDIDPVNLKLSQNSENLSTVDGRRSPETELTRREVDLLAYLIKHHDRPVSRHELLKEVWGYSGANVETRTVDIHVAKLRKKIEEDPAKPRFIVTVRGEGYKINN